MNTTNKFRKNAFVGLVCLSVIAALICFSSPNPAFLFENETVLETSTMDLKKISDLNGIQISLEEISLTDLSDGTVQADLNVYFEKAEDIPSDFLLRAAVLMTESASSRKQDLLLSGAGFPRSEHFLFTLPASWLYFEVIFRADGVEDQVSFRFSREDFAAIR